MPESFVEAEDLVNYPRSIGSVRVGMPAPRAARTVKVSLRGKGDVDVNRIAAQFGGGGHRNAAGCTVPGSLDEAASVLAAVTRCAGRHRSGRPPDDGGARSSPAPAGILVVDKGRGRDFVRRGGAGAAALGRRRSATRGTLDPDATGVLPLLVGEATKLMPYLADQDKEYVATIRLGVTTDTQDLVAACWRRPPFRR